MTAKEVLALIRATGKQHYVYVLHKPDGEPFYVGVGTWRRLLDHVIFARRPHFDSHKLRVIRKILREHLEVQYEIYGWFDERGAAERLEEKLIRQIGRRDLRTGPLSNVTEGGEGAANPSDEARERRSRSLRAAWAERDKSIAMAHLSAPDVRARAVAARVGKKRASPRVRWKLSQSERDARSRRLTENPISRRPDVAAKISRALKGRTRPDHHMKRPEFKERYSGARNPSARTVEFRGQKFETLKSAAAAFGVSRGIMARWLSRLDGDL